MMAQCRKDKEIILFQVMIGESCCRERVCLTSSFSPSHCCVGDERMKRATFKQEKVDLLLYSSGHQGVSQRHYDDDDHGARQTVDGTYVWCDATLNVLKCIARECNNAKASRMSSKC